MINIFFSPGGDDNATPLHDACSSGSVNMILLLVRFGARKDAKDRKGYVPRYANMSQDDVNSAGIRADVAYRVNCYMVTPNRFPLALEQTCTLLAISGVVRNGFSDSY